MNLIENFSSQDENPDIHSEENTSSSTGQVTKKSAQDIKVPKRQSVKSTPSQITETSGFNINYPKPLPIDSFPDKPVNGTLPSTIPNLRHMLACYGIKVSYNTIKKKMQIIIPGLSGCPDNADNTALAQIYSLASLNKLSSGQLQSYLSAIADNNQVNPVIDWITSKPWDGVNRLQALYDTICEQKDFQKEFKERLIYRWLLSCVAAALSPSGFHARGVLVYQGKQSVGKTTWFCNLISDEILRDELIKSDHHLDPSNKDTLIIAVSHWIVEIGELDSSFKKDIARIKGFITTDKDKIRQPYARAASEYQRRTVFCATVNSPTFLVDDTGNTRWWTIPVIKIDYDHGINMQQVFAQLKVDFDNGKQWWLTTAEEVALERHNKQFRSISVIHDKLSNAIDIEASDNNSDNRAMSATEILLAVNVKYPTNTQCKECHAFLREYIGLPKKIRGSLKWRIAFYDIHEINKDYGDSMD